MPEKEDIATISKRVQNKLRPQPVTPKPNPFPIVSTKTVQHSDAENICAHGVAPKRKQAEE